MPPPAPAAAATSSGATTSAALTVGESGYRLPENVTLQNAAKWSIVEDRPIMMDYWTHSIDKTALIGIKGDATDPKKQEKLLVKSEDEYTSPIVKIYRLGTDFIVMTENSIYLVDASIPVKRISV